MSEQLKQIERHLEDAHSALQHWEAIDETIPSFGIEALEEIECALDIVRRIIRSVQTAGTDQ